MPRVKSVKKVSTPSAPAEPVPALLARLADRLGVLPAHVPQGLLGQSMLRAAGVDPASITPHQLAEAQSLFRAGIADSLRRVDEHNQRVIARTSALAGHEAAGGQVRLARAAPEPAKPKPPRKPPEPRGVVIFDQPAGAVIRLMGRLGLSLGDARLALDELGGRGISTSTVRTELGRWRENHVADLGPGEVEELESFRGKGPAAEEIVKMSAAQKQEQRLDNLTAPDVGVVDF